MQEVNLKWNIWILNLDQADYKNPFVIFSQKFTQFFFNKSVKEFNLLRSS